MLSRVFNKFTPLTAQATRAFAAGNSCWGAVEKAPADPILGVNEAFKKDTNPKKQLLGVGAFRDNDGKPVTLDCVAKAEQIIVQKKMDHEYAPIDGLAGFRQKAATVAFGADSEVLKSNRVATCQSLSGTGALRLGFEFLKGWYPNKNAKIYVSTPTWPTHKGIANKAGFDFVEYRYFNKKTRGFDLEGMLEDLDKADNEQIIVLHACAHNPTGQDPTLDQWKQILEVCQRKRHLCAFDSAYQGFASGNLDQDAASIRMFVEKTDRVVLFQSFAKNFGLYGERIGNLNIVCADSNEADLVQGRLKTFARPMWSNPPIHGARIVDIILGDKELTASWHRDLIAMSSRMQSMRTGLVDNLKRAGSTIDWSHITNQIGMFAFTGMSQEQVTTLRDKYSIYMTMDGRISIAGLNTHNLQYISEAMHEVTKNTGI
jgi:aspartate aminotransferase